MSPPGVGPDTPRREDEEGVNGNQLKQRIKRISNNIGHVWDNDSQ